MRDKIISSYSKKLIAVFTAIAISLTGIPMIGFSLSENAYAGDGSEGPATVAEAEQALVAATQAKETAASEAASAQSAYNIAESDYNSAAETVSLKKQVMDEAETAYGNAVTERENALAEKKDAETAKNSAQNAYELAQQDLQEKTQAATTAQSEFDTAELAFQNAELKWAGDKQTAQEALTEKQAEYDNAGYNFINQKVNGLGDEYYTIDEIIAKEKQSTYGSKPAWNNVDQLYIKDIVADEDFIKIVKEICSYENLKKGIEIMRRTNQLRTKPIHNLNAIGANYQLIANAIVSDSVTAYIWGHHLIESSNYIYWTIDTPWNYRPRNENLSVSMSADYDPFDGLYYEERIVQLGKDNNGLTQEIIDSVAAEARADGSDYTPKSLEKLQGKTTTGHYLAIIEPELTAQGAACSNTPAEYLKYMGYNKFKARVAQAFNNTTKNVISIDAYETALEEFFSTIKSEFEEAQATFNALQSEPDYYQQASANLDAKTTALANANTAKDNASAAEIAAKNEFDTAKDTYDEKSAAYDSALETESGKRTEYETAQTAYNAAVTDCNNKEAAKNSAKTTLDSKNSALTTATETYNAAEAAYNEFFKLENAVITAVDDQVFTGEEIKPVLTVKNKGETVTLAEDTDYEVAYDNNVNAGTATATIKGTEEGQYNGSNSISFKINPKNIADNSVTVTVAGGSTYNGSGQTPEVTVKDGDTNLEANKDFEVAYNENVNAGENAKATIKGKGNYTGSRTQTFSIAPASLTGATIVLKPIGNESIEMGDTTVYVQETENAEIKPEIDSVTLGEVELTADDYYVAYSKNTAPGKEAKVSINGKGNYNGTAEVTFTIVSKAEFEIEENINQLNEELDALTQATETAKDNYKDAEEKAKASKAAADSASATPGQAAVNAAQKAADDAAVAEEAAKAVEIALADLQSKIEEIQQTITAAGDNIVVLKDKIEQYAGELQELSGTTANDMQTAKQNTEKAEQAKTSASSALEKAKSDKAEADKKAAEGTTPGQNENTNQDDPKTGNTDKAAGEKADADDDDDEEDAATIAKINAAKAAKVKIKGKALKKLKVQLTWKKVKNVSGFEVYQSDKKKGKFKKLATIKKGTAVKWLSKKIKKGKKGKKVFFKVRAFTIVDGDKVYGKWSNVKAIKLKK